MQTITWTKESTTEFGQALLRIHIKSREGTEVTDRNLRDNGYTEIFTHETEARIVDVILEWKATGLDRATGAKTYGACRIKPGCGAYGDLGYSILHATTMFLDILAGQVEEIQTETGASIPESGDWSFQNPSLVIDALETGLSSSRIGDNLRNHDDRVLQVGYQWGGDGPMVAV